MNSTSAFFRNIRHRVAALAIALTIVAGGLALGASPASAVTPSQFGAGWLTRSANGAVTSWSSTGAKPAITGHASGMYDVKFPGITADFGVPAVTPGNEYPGASCAIFDYRVAGGGVSVTLACVDRKGVRVESDFTVSYTSITGPNEGWVDADQPGLNGSYLATRRYDAVSATVTVAHNPSFPGQYKVFFPGIVLQPSYGSMIATAVGAMGNCNIGSENWSDHTVLGVYCYDAAGVPTDMRFVAHVVGSRSLLGAPTPKAGWATAVSFAPGISKPASTLRFTSNGKVVTVEHDKVGLFVFTFKELAGGVSQGAHVTILTGPGALDARCGAVAAVSGANAVVTVKCIDLAGKPADRSVTADVFSI